MRDRSLGAFGSGTISIARKAVFDKTVPCSSSVTQIPQATQKTKLLSDMWLRRCYQAFQIGRAQLSVLRHRDLAQLRCEPAFAFIPWVFHLLLQPFLALPLLPSFQIQIAPEARMAAGAPVMLCGNWVQMSEWFQPWHIRQGLGGVHVSLKHVPQRHYLFFRRLDPAQGGLAELFGGIAMHEHQAIKDTAGFNDSLHVGIEFLKGCCQFLAAWHRKAHFPRLTTEVAFSGFEALIQELAEEFVKGSE